MIGFWFGVLVGAVAVTFAVVVVGVCLLISNMGMFSR